MHRRESTANDDDQPHGDDFQRSEEAVGPRDGNERRVDPSTPPPSPTSPLEQSRSEEYDEHCGDLNIGEDFNRSEEVVGIRDGNVRRTDPSTVPPTPPPGNERLGSPRRGADSAGGSEETGGLLDEGGEQSGDTSLLVGELHWWTTDADLEAELCKYGRVKEIKFDVWDNGKSNGTCIVDFYDPMAAAACRDGMNGHVFNDRPCVVAWAPPPIVPRTLALPAQPRGSGGGDGSMLPCPRVAAAPPPPPAAAPPPPPVNPSSIRLVVPSPPLATPSANLGFFESMLPCLLVTAPPPSLPLAAPPPMNQASFGSMLPCSPVVALPPSVNPSFFGSMLQCPPVSAAPLLSTIVNAAATCPPVFTAPLSPTVNPAFFGSMLQCPLVSAAPLLSSIVNPAATCPPVSAAPLLSPIVNPAATCPPVFAAPLSPTVNPAFFGSMLQCPLVSAAPLLSPIVNPAFFGSMLQCPPVSSAAPLSPPTVNPAAPCPPVSAAARSPPTVNPDAPCPPVSVAPSNVNPAFFLSMLPTVNPAFLGSETTSAGAAEMSLNPGIGARWGFEEQPSKGEDSVQQGEASNEKKDRAKLETDRETQRDTETGRSRSPEVERDETPRERRREESEGEGDRDGHGAGDRHVDRHSQRVALQHGEGSHGKKDDEKMPERDREPSPSAK